MAVIDIGRICIKTHGREMGQKCVVVERVDKNFVVVTGPKDLTGLRRRRANVDHLSPTKHKLDIKSGEDDKAVSQAITKAKLEKFMKTEEET
jgi:large subunit ribosomal protein L14e